MARCIIRQQKIKHTTSIETSDALASQPLSPLASFFNTLNLLYAGVALAHRGDYAIVFFPVDMWLKSIRRCHMSLSTLFPNYPEGRYNCLAVMSHRQLIRRLRYEHYSPMEDWSIKCATAACLFCFNSFRNDK